MPTDQVRTLLAVVDEGTFDAAAVALHVTPSAVSQRVKALEQGIGRVLLLRTKPVRLTESGEVVGATPGEQVRQCLDNLAAVCAAAGATLGDAVRLTVYMTDIAAFAEVNEVYDGYFAADPPARAAVGVAGLPKGVQVEVDAIVALPD